MDDIVGSVAEKAGISEMKAKLAVAAVVEKLDGVLPGPIAGQVKKALGIDGAGMLDSATGGLLGGGGDGEGGVADMAKDMLGGGKAETGGAGGALGKLGGLFGKK